MFGSTGFSYNGVHSDIYNCFIGNVNKSNSDGIFGLGGIELIEEESSGDIPFFKKRKLKPISFTIQVFSEDEWNTNKRKQVASWLLQDNYKEFISDDDINVVYFAVCVGAKTIKAGNTIIGIELDFRCNAPYAFTHEIANSYTVDIGGLNINIPTLDSNYNAAYKEIEIEFTLSGTSTSLSLENTTDNRILTFSGLNEGETIYINNGRRKEIISSTGLNRYSNSNLNWLRLLPNTTNVININHACSIEFKYRLPIII